MIRFIDLFGGIGGFRLGLESISKNFKCVWYCDNDKWATQVYNKRFNENYEPRDIREINTEEIPDFDMLCAGFPCVAFSIAGARRGFEDTRGTLFFEIARIAKAKKPKIILLENVKGLLNHKKGNTFRIILQTLWELGYRNLQWFVLNSRYFGVPQNRERVFIIGYLRGRSGFQILPIREDTGEISEISKEETSYKFHRANEIREHKGSPTLSQAMGTGGNNQPLIKPNAGSGTIGKEDEAYCLDAGCNQGVSKSIIAMRSHPRTGTKEQDGERHQNIEPQEEDCSNTLTDVSKDNLVAEFNYGKLRRLTPVECERLQGFLDNWTKVDCSDIGYDRYMSDTQRYRQLGNAVTVNVIEYIGKKICHQLTEEERGN